VTPEGRVKNAIKAWLKKYHIWYFMPVSNGMGAHGIPDFICCWQGRFVGIEAKAPGKRNNVSPKQQVQIDAIQKAGGVAAVVDNVDQLLGVLEHANKS
jgi:hypothetical protein